MKKGKCYSNKTICNYLIIHFPLIYPYTHYLCMTVHDYASGKKHYFQWAVVPQSSEVGVNYLRMPIMYFIFTNASVSPCMQVHFFHFKRPKLCAF